MTMADSGTKAVVIGAAFGIIGVLVGSTATGILNLYAEKEERRLDVAMNSMAFESGQLSLDFIALKQFVEEIRNLSYFTPETVRRLADLQRQMPGCGDNLTDDCRHFMVETIAIMREELGSGKVANEDIETVLRGKYNKAQIAAENLLK